MLHPKLPMINDPQGDRVPANLPLVVDAHVHVFPQTMFNAVRQWFDTHAWSPRYRLSTTQIFEFLLSRGIVHIVALQYAHKPGIAAQLNRYQAEKCARFRGRVTGLATIYPGEKGAVAILQEAFDAGLGGVKLHAHVQCFDILSDAVYAVFDVCQAREKPMVIHFGTEPKSDAYVCDPYRICRADKLEQVLVDFPNLKLCVPHLGFGETEAYRRLIERYDTLWLDTTMVLTDYFPSVSRVDLSTYRLDRVFYGSDFPNIPFAWDRELKTLAALGLAFEDLDRILNKNAMAFFNIG